MDTFLEQNTAPCIKENLKSRDHSSQLHCPERCVLIMQRGLPIGRLVNACAILSITIGQRYPQIVGSPWSDNSGISHAGITRIGIPVLTALPEELKTIREKARSSCCEVVDCPTFAQRTMNYEEFVSEMQACAPEEIDYLGLALIGEKRTISTITKKLGLLQ